MKQQLHTIPVVEAFESRDECPFCYLQRQAEQRAIRFFAGPGASYMEPEIRGITNRTGFCPTHMKKLFDYGNPLGAALMLQSHLESILLSMEQAREVPEKKGLFRPKKDSGQPVWAALPQQVQSCAICDRVEENMQRQYRVFFSLLKEDEFRTLVENSKGFCLSHYARLLAEAEQHLPGRHRDWFYPTVQRVMAENLLRVKEDLDGLIAKYDYRNASLPWGNSKDALQRTMQKLAGIYPADPPYHQE